MWSVGVITYILVSGKLQKKLLRTFFSEARHPHFRKIDIFGEFTTHFKVTLHSWVMMKMKPWAISKKAIGNFVMSSNMYLKIVKISFRVLSFTKKGEFLKMKKITNISLISEVEWVQINAWHTHGSKISPKIEVANFSAEARFEDGLINSDGGKLSIQ